MVDKNANYKLLVGLTYDEVAFQKKLDAMSGKVTIKPKIASSKKDAEAWRNTWENAIRRIEARKAGVLSSGTEGGKRAAAELAVLKTTVASFADGGDITAVKRQFDGLNTSLVEGSAQMKMVSRDGYRMGEMLELAVKKIGLWAAGTMIFYGTINAVKQMIQHVKDLDKALVELQKVTDLSGASLNAFTDRAFAMGATVGKTGKQAIEAATQFAKAGYSIEESLKLGKEALIMSNIADGIENVDDAASVIISTLKGFNMEASETMRILDLLNEISNTSAVSFYDLSEGLRRVSAVFAQGGNSIEQTTALLTGGIEILRDPEMVSSGLIMISTRLRANLAQMYSNMHYSTNLIAGNA